MHNRLKLKESKNYLFPILYERVNCLNEIKDNNDFKIFLVNFKRLNNIIKSNKLLDISNVKLNIHLFESSEEQEIYDESKNLDINLKKYLTDQEHQGIILKEVINLHYVIHSFFEKIIVNHEDNKIKVNRIKLLTELTERLLKFSNFHYIEN